MLKWQDLIAYSASMRHSFCSSPDWRLSRTSPLVASLLLMANLAGCIAPPALDVSVMSYDKVTTDLLSQQLLLNIARARHHQPIHFTAVSNIAATFDFRFNAGAGPALTGNSGGMIMPTLGGSVAENPTITIVPIEGEEFTKRLLTPIRENMLTLLLRQGADVDLVLRLIAGEFRSTQRQGDASQAYHNRPNDPSGYAFFRRVALHLSSIQDRNGLYVEPLRFGQSWTFPHGQLTPEQFAALEKEYHIEPDGRNRVFRLAKIVTGRVVMTNYDPAILSNEERIRLNDWAEASPDNALNVDIRPGFPGGELPIHGEFRLRSLANVINFIGRGIADEPEFAVEKDPLTPAVADNPAQTMAIMETDSAPDDVDIAVSFNDRHYALHPERGYQWNHEAFTLLHQMFQMTVTELPRAGVPSLTIAK